MKLKNSVPAATKIFTDMIYNDNRITGMVGSILSNPAVKDKKKAIRWNMYFLLTQEQKDKIFCASLNPADQIGGYWPDLNDSHIETLLNHSISDGAITLIIALHQ